MLFVRRHCAFSFGHYRYYYIYHDQKYVDVVRMNVVLKIGLLFTVTDVSIFRVKVSSIASVNGSKLWLLALLVN